MFKSNYAANQKRDHISYINTFKDIFLIILFFSDNILQRNLINTLRDKRVQHANVQGAFARSVRRRRRRRASLSPSRCRDRRGMPGPFLGLLSPVRTPAGRHWIQPGRRGKFPSESSDDHRRVLGAPPLPSSFIHSFIHSFNTAPSGHTCEPRRPLAWPVSDNEATNFDGAAVGLGAREGGGA